MKNKRILIVEVNWLGDVLFSTAAIRALKNKYPDSFICALVHKRCKDVLVDNPYLDEIIVLDEDKEHKGFSGKLRLIKQLKAERFDTAYLFHRSFTRALICFLSAIKNRIGYYTAKRRFLLTESVTPPKGLIHRAAYYYYLVTRDIPVDTKVLCSDFIINEDHISFIENILEREGIKYNEKLVVMHPAGNWLLKRWPKENFAQLADELTKRFNVTIIFSGAPGEHGIIRDILHLMKSKAINLCGVTTLKQLGALFQRADLVISADSGPLHISIALNRPTIALFGPTSPVVTGPLNNQNTAMLLKEIDCTIPCYKLDCQDNLCMRKISVEDVLNCIEEKRWLRKDR